MKMQHTRDCTDGIGKPFVVESVEDNSFAYGFGIK